MKVVIARIGFCIVAAGLVFIPRTAAAGTATDQLRTTIKSFVKILAKTPVSKLRANGLPEAALNLVFARFDFVEMTRLSLGNHWKSLEAREQMEFVAAFTHRILVTYGRTVRSGGEDIRFKGEVVEGDRVSVETEVDGDIQPLSINYQLHDIQGQWRVYDVVIGDVSMVSNFRSQFDRIIAKTSLKELLHKIKQIDS